MIIGIDIDETIYPLMKEWIDLYRSKTGHNLTLEDFKTYGIHNTMTQLPRDEVYALLDFIKYECLAYPNAVKVITELGLAGHRIVFHSTVHDMKQAEFKLTFLRRNFVRFEWDVIFGTKGTNKLQYVQCADIIIEDSPDSVEHIRGNGHRSTIILLSKPYNRHVGNPDIVFLRHWYDIECYFSSQKLFKAQP